MAPVQPVKALISMKGNSARVPRKNVKLLAGKPLFFWIVDQLIKARHVSDVSVETDDDEIEAISNELFPQVRVLRRPDELLGDFVSMNPLIAHHLANVEGEYFLQTHSTNPLIRAETIDGAIEAFFNAEAHDSLLSVTALHTRLYWPDGRAVNHDPSELLPTQHLPPIYEENSCLYIFSRASFAATGLRLGKTPMLYPTPAIESVDIDEHYDFAVAETLMRRRLGA
jgi:N-acylneuraminate cytidylyltransferase